MRYLLFALLLFGLSSGAGIGQRRFPGQPPGSFTDADLKKLPAALEGLSLRGHLGYGADNITAAGIKHLAQYRNLRILSVGAFGLPDSALEPLAQLANLEELNLDSNKIRGEGLRHLVGLKKLRRLNLNFNPIAADAFQTLANMPELTHLSTYSTGPVDDRILQQIGKLTNLQDLRLSEDTLAVTDRGLTHLAKLKGLTNLALNGAKITDTGLAHIAEHRSLRELSLRDLSLVTSGGLKVLEKLPELRRLDIDRVPMNEQSVRALGSLQKLEQLLLWSVSSGPLDLEPLGGLKSLRTFRTNQPVGGGALRSLAKLEHLESITDELTEIADEDLKHLARLPRLHTLVLGSDRITAASLPTLAKMTSLRHLYVTEKVGITPEQWTALGRSSLTKCQISRFRPPYTVFSEPKAQ